MSEDDASGIDDKDCWFEENSGFSGTAKIVASDKETATTKIMDAGVPLTHLNECLSCFMSQYRELADVNMPTEQVRKVMALRSAIDGIRATMGLETEVSAHDPFAGKNLIRFDPQLGKWVDTTSEEMRRRLSGWNEGHD